MSPAANGGYSDSPVPTLEEMTPMHSSRCRLPVALRFAPGAVSTWSPGRTVAWGSGRPSDTDAVRVQDHVDDLRCVMDAEGMDRAVVVGWSIGVADAFRLTKTPYM